MTTFIGTVLKKIQYNKAFIKVIVLNNNQFCQVIIKNNMFTNDLKNGMTVNFIGEWDTYKNKAEFHANEFNILFIKKEKILIDQVINNQKLYIRSVATQQLHESLNKLKVLPVQSPTIVSNWVKGNTNPLNVKYYGHDYNLSISNMMYHQLMINSGMNDIYEIGKLHREEKSSGKKKLSEFTTVDISRSYKSIDNIMEDFEYLITDIWKCLKKLQLWEMSIVDSVSFSKISYESLLKNSGQEPFLGSQLTKKCRDYLNNNYNSFVWVTGFDVSKRPFYTKSNGTIAYDTQLWYRGKQYIAAGSAIEDQFDQVIKNMRRRKNDSSLFQPYLYQLKKGFPPMSMLAMGFEMLLSHLVENSFAIDYAYFPRTEKSEVF